MSSDEPAAPRKLRRLALVLIVSLLLLTVAHQPLLSGMYRFLVSADDIETVSFAVLMGADRAGLDRAADLVAQGAAERILIVERRLPRTSRLGITPPPGELIRGQLIERGVGADSIANLRTEKITNWQLARSLDKFLQNAAPTAQVGLVCAEPQTRYIRFIVNQSVDPARTDHYRIWPYPSGRLDMSKWWRNRKACIKVAVAYLRFAHALAFGEGEFHEDNWSPEAYEESIRIQMPARAA